MKNPRINITLDKKQADIISDLAKENHQSVASLVKELTYESLLRREDLALSELANLRDQEQTVSHDKAWANI
jgi:hypothetical protein